MGSCPETLILEDDANCMALALQCLHEDINSSHWGHFRDCVMCLRAWQIIDDQQLVIVIVTHKGKCSCSWDVNKMLNHEGHGSSGRVAIIKATGVQAAWPSSSCPRRGQTAELLGGGSSGQCLFIYSNLK